MAKGLLMFSTVGAAAIGAFAFLAIGPPSCETSEESAERLIRRQHRQLEQEQLAKLQAEQQAVKKAQLEADASRPYISPQQRADAALEAAYKSRDAFDAAVRENNAGMRKALEKAAVRHWRSNSGGSVMVDTYVLRDGRSINCVTKIANAGPAIFNCDGEH